MQKDGKTVTDSRDTENEPVPLVISLLLGERGIKYIAFMLGLGS